KEGADRIPASLMRSLTRTALTKDGEENPLLVKIFRNEVKILQSKNVHLIVLAVNGRKRHILTKPKITVKLLELGKGNLMAIETPTVLSPKSRKTVAEN